MIRDVEWVANEWRDRARSAILNRLNEATAGQALSLHNKWPEYGETPLVMLDTMARALGARTIGVKDEARRFNLSSFKVLGVSHAVLSYLVDRFGLTPSQILTDGVPQRLTLTTATDGNHGSAVAWVARRLGLSSVIFVPTGVSATQVDRMQHFGGDVRQLTASYDDTVDRARSEAEHQGWILVQDTAGQGPEAMPVWVMEGYLTMALESLNQWHREVSEPPTHVFLQAGVGSMAAAVTALLAHIFGETGPTIVVVEPTAAAQFYASTQTGDGSTRVVRGPHATVMTGLACGRVNPLGWQILRSWATVFAACPDDIAARGVRILSNPLPGDRRILAGESGAVTTGLAVSLFDRPTDSLRQLRRVLRIDHGARILLFNTEGPADFKMTRRIIWDGHLPYREEAVSECEKEDGAIDLGPVP